MIEPFQPMPDGASTWRPDRTPYDPKPNKYVVGGPEIGVSGVSRYRLDQTFLLPPEQRAANDQRSREVDVFTPERPGLASGTTK